MKGREGESEGGIDIQILCSELCYYVILSCSNFAPIMLLCCVCTHM